jgi:hypothetical protein
MVTGAWGCAQLQLDIAITPGFIERLRDMDLCLSGHFHNLVARGFVDATADPLLLQQRSKRTQVLAARGAQRYMPLRHQFTSAVFQRSLSRQLA